MSGSAHYLDDRVKTTNTARVSFKYDTKTFLRQIKPDLFMEVDYPEVLKKAPGATHVVTGIEFGVGAVFVFDQKISKDQTIKEVEGSMKIFVKSIPGIEIDGSGHVNITEEQKGNTEQFSCTFHGDLVLTNHPGNYIEAIKVYKDLPKYLGENFKNSVPMTVYLYPLDSLLSTKDKEMVYDIRNSLVQEVAEAIDELASLETRCNNILLSDMIGYHQRFRHNVDAFQSHIHLFTLLFKQTLGTILPTVRESGNEALLQQMLVDKEASTFSKHNLELWMDEAEQEALVLESTHSYPHYCRSVGEFSAKIMNEVRFTLALVMRLDTGKDLYLDEMKTYLDENKKVSRNTPLKPFLAKTQKWWTTKIKSDMQKKSAALKQFAKLMKKLHDDGFETNIQFLTMDMPVKEDSAGFKPSVTLELYENAKMIDADYQIPSEPGIPYKLNASYDSITLAWDKPLTGEDNVVSYEVHTFVTRNDSELVREGVSTVAKGGLDETFETTTFFGLKPQSIYFFTIYAVTIFGRTSVSSSKAPLVSSTCPAGMYLVGEECHFCDPGFYSEISGAGMCLKCPIGTYEPKAGGKGCIECPKGTTTLSSGSKYIDDCGADLNGKIENSLRLDELTKNITNWKKSTDKEMKRQDFWIKLFQDNLDYLFKKRQETITALSRIGMGCPIKYDSFP